MQSVTECIRLSFEKLKHNIISVYFLICTSVLFIFNFIAYAYTDMETDAKYFVYDVLIKIPRETLGDFEELTATKILRGGIDSFAVLFVPILVTIPFAFKHCVEYRSGMKRCQLVRCGYKSYLISDVISAFVGAGLSCLIGRIIFIIFVYLYFPGGMPQGEDLKDIVLQLLCFFLMGVVSTVPVLVLSAVSQNEYVLVTIPFAIFYFESVLIRKVVGSEMNFFSNIKMELVPDLYCIVNYVNEVLLYHLGMIVFAGIIYVVLQKRRFDYGK